MSSISNHQDLSATTPDGSSAGQGRDSRARAIQSKWAALRDAGDAVCALAGPEARRPSDEIRDFPEFLHSTSGWRLDLAARAIDDLAAVMEQGLSALLSARARGADARAAAAALWREFEAATTAIAALAPPPHEASERNPEEAAHKETA